MQAGLGKLQQAGERRLTSHFQVDTAPPNATLLHADLSAGCTDSQLRSRKRYNLAKRAHKNRACMLKLAHIVSFIATLKSDSYMYFFIMDHSYVLISNLALPVRYIN